MTATLKSARKENAGHKKESAPYSAGILLCELMEAVETLENHVIFGRNGCDDHELAVQVIANLGERIRKQAIAEQLVRSFEDDKDGTTGRLAIGKALQAADAAVYHDNQRRLLTDVKNGAPSYTRAELAEALRIVRQGGAGLAPELNEMLEAVQYFFEVVELSPERVQRPSSLERAWHASRDAGVPS